MKTFFVFTLIFLFVNLCISQERKAAKPLLSDHYVKFAPNNNSIWFGNNGDMCFNPNTNAAGWEWPIDSNKFVGFELGFLYAGAVNGNVYSGGSAYRHGLKGGKILPSGKPSDSTDNRYRIYHIKKEDAITGSNPDYNEWSSQDGAPMDSNGKPLFLGDEQLWFVSHDLDSTRTRFLYGSNPIGIEVQTTVWAFSKNTYLKDAIFVRHIMINKSQSDVKDMYVALWADYDLGDANDDLVGVDTTLQLEFVYNGKEIDHNYRIPPVAGRTFLQTPVISSAGDTIFFLGNKKPGYKYAPLSGYTFFYNASSVYKDPEFGSYRGTIDLNYYVRGLVWNGNPFIDPTTGNTTKFIFAGDPTKNIGWIDGTMASPSDRRSMLSAGPFTLAKGDTQEVVYAMLARQGIDRINSLDRLKEYAGVIKTFYRHQKYLHTTPITRVEAYYPQMNSVTLRLEVVDSNAIACEAVLMHKDDNVVMKISLYDDGLHGDGTANDHNFGATWTTTAQREGVDVFFDMKDPEGFTYRLHGKRRVPLAGAVRLVGTHIESDHLNQDGEANPGENIRITLDVKNETPFTIKGLECNRLDGTIPTNDIYSISDSIASGAIGRRDYKIGGSKRFVTVDIPPNVRSGDIFKVHFRIDDTFYNRWEDSVEIEIDKYLKQSSDSLITHVAGPCTGTLGIRILNPSEWKDRAYKVTIRSTDSIPDCSKSAKLFDLFEKKEKANVTMPDNYAHDFPTVDGFRLTQGTTSLGCIYYEEWENNWYFDRGLLPSSFYLPPENKWLKSIYYYDWMVNNELYRSIFTPYDLVPIKIVFSNYQNQYGYLYLRGSNPNYQCLGFGVVPFKVYDISDSLRPRQVNVAFVEQNGSKAQDRNWMPTTSSNDREYLLILKSTYSGQFDSSYTKKNINSLDLLYVGWFIKISDTSTYHEGDQIFICPIVPISWRDTFIVNIKGKIARVNREVVPNKVTLSQNYPNPFASSTAIGYRLSAFGNVKLEVFDILGRKVATLVDEEQESGVKQIELKVKEKKLHNGIYFYQLKANGQTIRKKMIVLQ